ncbi:MAG: hypothetical protein O4861_14470, partial [Trichodesmium sp. St16_bin4-tuft]|nr:hypothetical protein [Trichodesmium sp. St5_bin8]MDE5077313.1 hypothetical protein [Trichodesmium sp. St2_bin6]MDE5099467.1 hypothetical protein [Trichodesmium sp. St16_bin4-tuft]MDE5101743.1 hypothetical protein [Trichodesmium sp. St19_bin2]
VGDRLEQGWLVHSRKNNTAAQRAGLAIAPWSWNDHYTYPTLCALHYRLLLIISHKKFLKLDILESICKKRLK